MQQVEHLNIFTKNVFVIQSVQWDGHSGSGREAQRLASSKVTAEEQIEYTKKTLGLLTDEKLEKIGPQVNIHTS